jgi:hypothetical protein
VVAVSPRSARHRDTPIAPMKAQEIVALLADKHAEDVFVPECKGGPTWGGEHLRLDAWAMRKSWSRPLVWGYEVKVSRADFTGDDKWHAYLPYCNEFYFVCPTGLIAPNEVPPEVGLLYVAKTGSRLFNKKQAQRRTQEIPEDLYRYLLMSRCLIDGEPPATAVKTLEYWRAWLSEKEESRGIGWRVSKGVAEHVERVEHENYRLKEENASLALFRDRLVELGHDPTQHVRDWQARDAVQKLRGDLPPWLTRALRDVRDGLDMLHRNVLTAETPNPGVP